MLWRKKAYKDFNPTNNCSSYVIHYTYGDWTICENESNQVKNDTYGRFTIIGKPGDVKPNIFRLIDKAYGSFDETVREILGYEKAAPFLPNVQPELSPKDKEWAEKRVLEHLKRD